MAVTTTYSFNLPTVGGDTNAWGSLLNDNFDAIDDLFDGTTPVTGIDIDGGTIDGTAVNASDLNATGTLGADLLAAIVDHLHPVGSTIINTDGVNPGTQFPGTTWVATAEGRAIVGAGTSDSGGGFSWTGGQKRGNETHTLTQAELPAHAHSGTTGAGGAHAHTHFAMSGSNGKFDPNGGLGNNTGETRATNPVGDHTHPFTTNSVGSNSAHNNLQPSMAFYVWERTA